MESTKDFFLSKKVANQYLYMGVTALVIGVIFLVLIGNVTLLGIGILFTIMGVLNQSLKIIKLYPQYLEVKLGVIASKKLIKYDQITGFSVEKKMMILHYNNEKNEPKKVKFHIKAFEKEDIIELDQELKQKTDLEPIHTFIQTGIE
ncbi:hypothetical protein [Aquimarina muelleri]|uniref:Uncharacterized protein n=1 Tax=Aquimarina muelleri TaxID=279356 RepID=A0A918N3V8_9FLAO|nr:hypothetical protein [Aquimarina muelleri]MCX2764849.1 hypothetical protein [Aquimarina muelleri]GGX14822.1 hypothetical protein GCM10007384_15590 [Aquimarina muelleri]